jgi:hypothetical protein
MKKLIHLVFITGIILYSSASKAQKCPKESNLVTFNDNNSSVSISACVAKKPSLGAQTVLWGVRNNTADKLDVRFTKVIYLVCGNTMRNQASVIIKPGAFMGGGTFFGDDITLDDQVWKENCNRNDNRISRVGYENLKVINLSKNERDDEARMKLQEDKRIQDQETKRKADEAEALQKKEETEKQRKAEEDKLKKEEDARLKLREEENRKEKEKEEKAAQEREVKRIQDSIDYTWKERNDRVEQVKKDQQEKAAITAGMAAGVGALMLSETDNSKIVGKRTYFKAGAFMGMKNIPVYENMRSSQERAYNYTSANDHSPIYGEVELQVMLYKSKLFSFEVTPNFQYGLSFYGGNNGTYLGYGGNSTVTFGNKLKIYAVGGYESRLGENTYDMDAGSESIGIITNTKAMGTSSYDYSVISYGGGLMLDTNSGDESEAEDKFIQIGGIIHKPSLTDARNSQAGIAVKQLIGGQFKWVFGGGFTLAAEYIPDYTIAGTKTYEPRSKDKKDYWFIKIGKVFNL